MLTKRPSDRRLCVWVRPRPAATTTMSKRHKPTGTTGRIEFGPDGPIRKWVTFPETKDEIELFIAEGFCANAPGYRPHLKRYGQFTELRRQRENSIDFHVTTEAGDRWLELCEFAPLDEFGGPYAEVPP